MSRAIRFGVTLVALAPVVLVVTALAAYDPITWYSIDGGGTTAATSGGWTLSGTIGQYDAGSHTGGTFTLGGGFWQGGLGAVVGVPEAPVVPGLAFRFWPAAPNPVRGACRLSFDLAAAAPARVLVHDVAGRVVRTMELGSLPAGHHEREWHAEDDKGERVANGVYFIRLDGGASRAVQKVLVIR